MRQDVGDLTLRCQVSATIDLYFPRGAELSVEPIEDQTRRGTVAERTARAADKHRA